MQLSHSIFKSTTTVMESLFGDAPPPCGNRATVDDNLAQAIFPRTLLPWSVIHNPAAGMVRRVLYLFRKCRLSKGPIPHVCICGFLSSGLRLCKRIKEL